MTVRVPLPILRAMPVTRLAAGEFTGLTFHRLDANNSGVTEYPEWKETYFKSRSPLNTKQWRYNQ